MVTAADADMQSGEQGQAAEADGRRVRATPRWAALCTEIGDGERVKISRALKRNVYRWGGGKREGGNINPEIGRRNRLDRRARLNSNNKQRSLVAEWEMSEVGIPPPHNSDNPHALMASINNNNNRIPV